jgi:hypothetical protein
VPGMLSEQFKHLEVMTQNASFYWKPANNYKKTKYNPKETNQKKNKPKSKQKTKQKQFAYYP